jgi:hypothetical protein
MGVTAFAVLRTNISTMWKMLAVPAALFGALLIPLFVVTEMGKAVPVLRLPDRFNLIAHKVIIDEGKKKHIEIWGYQTGKRTRAYIVPYSKGMEELLKKAQQGSHQGFVPQLRRNGDGRKPQIEHDGLQLHLLNPSDLMGPKEGLDENPELQILDQPADPKNRI